MQVAGGGGSAPATTSITVSGQKLTFVGAEAESAAQRLENVARILGETSAARESLNSMKPVGGDEVSAMGVRNFRTSMGSASEVVVDAINEVHAAVAQLRATAAAYATQDGDL